MLTVDQAAKELQMWMKTPEKQILEIFKKLSGAISYETGDFESLFIPGTRPDRVLLVAHVDTVWNDSPKIEVDVTNGIMYSKNRKRGLSKKTQTPFSTGFGIGADDRAGIAILSKLKDIGHSLLITSGEESGCLGAVAIACNYEMSEMINGHQFAVEFDRRGRNDLVFYDVGTPEFIKYCELQTGYRHNENCSSSDISVLCHTMCGVNMSVGYKNEHTENEILNIQWWLRTLNTAHFWLSQNNIPKFGR